MQCFLNCVLRGHLWRDARFVVVVVVVFSNREKDYKTDEIKKTADQI